jgi:hypothetical protein
MVLEAQLLLFLDVLVVVSIPKLLMLVLILLVRLVNTLMKTHPSTQVLLLITSETMLVILLVWALIFLDHWLNLLALLLLFHLPHGHLW